MADNQGASQRRRSTGRPAERDEARTRDTTDSRDEGQADLSDVDALLDEIDEVLEENAEDFVRNYVQKGGQ